MDALARESTVKKVGIGAVQKGAPLYVLWTDADTQEYGKKGHPYPCGVRVACVQHDIGLLNQTFLLYKCGLLQLVSQEQLGQLAKKSNEILASKTVSKMQQKSRADMEPLHHETEDADEDGNEEHIISAIGSSYPKHKMHLMTAQSKQHPNNNNNKDMKTNNNNKNNNYRKPDPNN
jgi:hypothetical protein